MVVDYAEQGNVFPSSWNTKLNFIFVCKFTMTAKTGNRCYSIELVLSCGIDYLAF